jgi:hypothetical protein
VINRRTPRSRAFAPDPDAPGRSCDLPGCDEPGGYRAPKSRTTLTDYHWFCLEHVRAYNAKWDYYKGMTPGQIEAQIRADTAWQRPTWPLGRLGSGMVDEEVIRDPLGVLAAGGMRGGRRGAGPAREEAPPALREPLLTLGLDWPVSLEAAKSRYKDLAKLHHPDANNGSRDAEERLKTINLAYSALRRHLNEAPVARAG